MTKLAQEPFAKRASRAVTHSFNLPTILRNDNQRVVRDLDASGDIQPLKTRAIPSHGIQGVVREGTQLRNIQRLQIPVAFDHVRHSLVRQLGAISQREALDSFALREGDHGAIADVRRQSREVESPDKLRVGEEGVCVAHRPRDALHVTPMIAGRPMP